jgi:hypothetical protein
MAGPIVIPDATSEPGAYVAALLDTLGDAVPSEVYAATPQRVRDMCAGLDDPDWLVPMGPGEWNAHQIVGHLVDVDIVYGFRWRLTLTEDVPSYPGYDEKAWSRLARPSPTAMVECLARLREVNLALLQGLDDDDWRRRGMHGEQGEEDVTRMLRKVAGHDLAHLDQLRRTLDSARRSTPT